MKESAFKIVVLALLLAVFTAVAITARWVDKSDYDRISCPSKDPDKNLSQDHSSRHQTGNVSARADAGGAESEATSAVAWTDLNGYSRDKVQQQGGSAERRANRLSEEPDDGGEPPDDNKDTYGSDDVE